MHRNRIPKADQHFLVSCCLESIFSNVFVTENNSKKVLKRLIDRNEQLKNIILKNKFSEKEINSLQRKANQIASVYKDFLTYDIVIFQKTLLILIDFVSKDVPDTDKYKELKKTYQYIEKSAFTFFNHIDKILHKEGENWERFRRTKAELLSQKLINIIGQ